MMKKIKQFLCHAELSRAKKQAVKAKSAPVHDADTQFNDAYRKFAVAAQFDPTNSDVLHHWGLALLDHARIKGGVDANKLFKSASDYFQRVLKIDPNNAKVWNDWGAALMEQARQKSSQNANALYRKAKEKFIEAERLDPGLAAYNLACLHSLQGDAQECRNRLEQARERGRLPSKQHLKSDEDLKAFRDEPWFKEFVESLSKKEESAPSA